MGSSVDGSPRSVIDELLRRSRWPVLRRLGIHPGGDERSALRGSGIEFLDVREYQPGDDPRTIEWNVTARSDRPYVRESTPDRGVDTWFLVDVTRSLDWGTARCLKRQLALEVVTVAGQLLTGRGNRVGALLFDSQIRAIVRPAAGRTALLQLIARIDRVAETPAATSTDLARALTESGRLVRKHSLLILVTDFLVPDGWKRSLRQLGLRHEVIAAWISDPRECEIPDVGVVTFEDPEEGRQLTVDTHDPRLRARFQAAAEEQRALIRANLREARADLLELTTGAELMPQLLTFMKRRELEKGRRVAPVGG